jgi:hypothetical protein
MLIFALNKKINSVQEIGIRKIEDMKPSCNKPSLQRGPKCANCVQIHYISQYVKFLNLLRKTELSK